MDDNYVAGKNIKSKEITKNNILKDPYRWKNVGMFTTVRNKRKACIKNEDSRIVTPCHTQERDNISKTIKDGKKGRHVKIYCRETCLGTFIPNRFLFLFLTFFHCFVKMNV